MFKFIHRFLLIAGLFFLNIHPMMAQHPNVIASFNFHTTGSLNVSSVYVNNGTLGYPYNFDLDIGIYQFYVGFSNPPSSPCPSGWSATFPSTPWGNFSVIGFGNPSCGLANIYYGASAHRINNNLSLGSSNFPIGEDISFTGPNFDNGLQEYLQIEIYDNAGCTGTALASFNLGEGIASFKLQDQVSSSVYESLINQQLYLKVNYLSPKVTYTSSDFVVFPITIVNKVDLQKSIFSQNEVSCFGGTNGGIKIDKIKLKNGQELTNVEIVFSIKKLIDTEWRALVPEEYATFTNSTNYIALDGSLPAGSDYRLVVWSSNIGADSIDNFTITQPSAVSFNTITTQPICAANLGRSVIYPEGGNGEYMVTMNGVSKSSDYFFDNLPPDTYTIQVEDIKSCSATPSSITINAGWDPNISTNIANPACPQTPNGGITLIVNGTIHNTAQSGYTYYLNNAAVSYPFTNLLPGTYESKLTDNRGCSSNSENNTLSYDTSNDPVLTSNSITQPKCYEVKGSVSLSVSKGHGPSTYTYKCSGIADVPGQGNLYTYSNLDNGNLALSVTDALGCPSNTINTTLSYTNSLIVSGNPIVKQTIGITNYHFNCNGDLDGSISISASSSPKNIISYKLFDINNIEVTGKYDAGANNFNPLAAGTFTIAIKDEDGCTKSSAPIHLLAPPKVIITSDQVSSANVTCYGKSDGSITIGEVKGGTEIYSYSFDNGNNYGINKKEGCSASTYYLIAKDSKGCLSDVVNKTISEPALLTAILNPLTYAGGNQVSCHGSADGRMQVTIGGGNANYAAYLFHQGDIIASDYSNAMSTKTGVTGPTILFSDLPMGKYKVAVVDANGCNTLQSDSIAKQPASLTISDVMPKYKPGSIYHISCNGYTDGEINVTLTGGSLPYTVYLKNNASSTPLIKTITTGSSVTFGDNQLGVGFYKVRVVDANGCQYPADGSYTNTTYQLIEPLALYVSLPPPPPANHGYYMSCYNDVTSLTPTVSGGNGSYDETNYIYSWSNGQSVKTANGLRPGTISLTVTDNKNCPSATSAVTLNQPSALYFSNALIQQPKCAYLADGQIAISAIGGVPSYTITNEGNGDIKYTSSASFGGLKDGYYKITCMDNNGCTHDTTINVKDYTALSLSITNKNSPHCFGGTDGSLQINGLNGNPVNGTDYKFRLYNGITKIDSAVGQTATFKTLPSGSYKISIIDGFGCTDTISSILNPASPILYTITSVPNHCYNDHTAQLKVKATSGNGSFMFAYRYGSDSTGYLLKTDSTLLLTNLNWNQNNSAVPLEYHFYISDANYTAGQPSCSVHDMVVLPRIEKLTPHLQVIPISCFGANDGKISVTQTENAEGNIVYAWSGPKEGIEMVTSNSIASLPWGTYNVTVKDQRQCEYTESRTLQDPLVMSIAVMNTVAETGTKMNDGKAFFKVTGTRDTISYSIDEGLVQTAILNSMSFLVEPLTPGSHTITIANPSNLSCKVSTSFKIKHQPPTLVLLGKRNATPGNADGMISVMTSGGTSGYIYIWTNETGDTLALYKTATATTLRKGTYSIVAMDSDSSLSNTLTIPIIESDQLALGLVSETVPTCRLSANGNANVSAGGGTKPYTYWWTNSQGKLISLLSSANNLLPGNYTAHVRDSYLTEASIEVSMAPMDSIKNINLLVAQPKCYNENSAQIKVNTVQGGSGNFSYRWSTGNTGVKLDNVGIGTYTVTVFDNTAPSQLCYFEKSVTIANQPTALALHADSIISPLCYDGNNGKIYVSANGGTIPYTIEWSGSTVLGNSYYNATAGRYEVKVTDGNGCQAFNTILVENPSQLQFRSDITLPKCIEENNGTISLHMLNGQPSYSAKWTPDLKTNSLSVTVPAGFYAFEITDANGCKVNSSFNLQPSSLVKIDSFSYTLPNCNMANGSIKAIVSRGEGPYAYNWSDHQKGQTATNLSSGKYTITVTDKNLCQITGNAELKMSGPVILSFKIQEPVCSGYTDGSLVISAQGGTEPYSCLFNNKSSGFNITGLSAGNYSVVVKDANNCSASQTVWLNQPSPLAALESILSEVTCAYQCNGHVKLNVSGSFAPYSVLWNDGASGSERTDLCARTFEVKVKDDHGCPLTKFISLKQPDSIVLTNIIRANPICFGQCNGNIEIACSGGTQPYAINWNNGQTGKTAKNLCAGKYTVTITDLNKCPLSKMIEINDPIKETIETIPTEFKICEGQKNMINPGKWNSYTWYLNNTKVSNVALYNANQAGNYKITTVSNKGCKDSSFFTVYVSKNLLSAKFLIPNDVITGDTVEIIDVSWPIPDSIRWHMDSENAQVIRQLTDRQLVVFKDPGEYSIQLIAKKALCISEDEQTITVYNNTGEKIDGKQPIKSPSDIQDLYLFPNPNTGAFTVKIKLRMIGKVSLQIIKLAENKLIALKESDNSDLYEFGFNLPGMTSGVYLLNLQTNTSQKFVKFVIMN